MKNIFLIALTFLLLQIALSQQQSTRLTYFSQHQVQSQSDYIQISITVDCQDRILKTAVQNAQSIVSKLQQITLKYCLIEQNSKGQCQQTFESSKNNIKPKYQLVRKVETFMAFIVSHQIHIKIINIKGMGKMVDQLLQAGEGLIKIDNFQWKAENQKNPQKQALKSGMSDGEQICQKMGLKLSKIISVQEVDHKQDQQEQKKQGQQSPQQQQDEQEQQKEIIVFKFQVECKK